MDCSMVWTWVAWVCYQQRVCWLGPCWCWWLDIAGIGEGLFRRTWAHQKKIGAWWCCPDFAWERKPCYLPCTWVCRRKGKKPASCGLAEKEIAKDCKAFLCRGLNTQSRSYWRNHRQVSGRSTSMDNRTLRCSTGATCLWYRAGLLKDPSYPWTSWERLERRSWPATFCMTNGCLCIR